MPRSTRAAQAVKMLAKNALALRRVTPVGHRCMSALAGNVDKMAENAAQMEKALPEMLKPLAADMVRPSHSLPFPPCTRQPSAQHKPPPSALAPLCAPKWGLPCLRAVDWFHSVW